MTTVKTALCLIPPENVWEQIQAIRSGHDRAYPRWMPHINLVYPFVPEGEFSRIKARLEPLLNGRQALEIEFDQTSFHYFKQKGSECTFHLRPKQTQSVTDLYQIIENALPNYVSKTRPFEAHLTLGQTTTSRISDVLIEMKAKWKSITFTIDRVSMISRENAPDDLFSIKSHILLIGSEREEDSFEQPPPSPPMEIPSVTFTPSNYCLCIIPPQEFSSRLLHLFENSSFRPMKPFRIVLAEYNSSPNESEIRSQVEFISKFTLSFGARSICFNYSTGRLFLKPIDVDPLQRLNFNRDKNFDGTVTLGELDKTDLTDIGERFTQSWTSITNEFEVDRVHLIDSNNRFQCSFLLKNQCFS